MTQGAIPYVDFITPKPPLVYEFLTILSLLSGGDMLVYDVLVVSLTAAAIGSVSLVGIHVNDITDNSLAAVTAGLVLLTYPPFHLLPGQGIRVKFFTCSLDCWPSIWSKETPRLAVARALRRQRDFGSSG